MGMSDNCKHGSCDFSLDEAEHELDGFFCLEASFKGNIECSAQACEKLMDSISMSPAAGDWFEISLLLQEAVNNAVLHGCSNCSDHEVKVTVCSNGSTVEVHVKHNGAAWDWQSEDWELPDPDSVCGRGLFIIDSYAHEKKISDDGRSMLLIRRLSSD